jgi:fatty acid desaturase
MLTTLERPSTQPLSELEIRELSRIKSAATIVALLVDYALVVFAFVLAAACPNPMIWLVCFVLVARQQLALAILMHDAAHKRLFNSVALNDFVGQFFCAAPLLFSMYSYRTLHLKHHQAPLSADDPDLSLIGGYPISKKSFARKLLRDALGISYFKFIRYFLHMASKGKTASNVVQGTVQRGRDNAPLSWIVTSVLAANVLIFAALAAAHHPWFYLTLWLLPAITALQVLLRIRGIAEHAGYEYSKNQMLSARTVSSSWQTLLCAPHSVNYHIEHHVYPSIPHYNLQKVHALLKQRRLLPESNVYSGYDSILRELIT